jgi:hypothetical protein
MRTYIDVIFNPDMNPAEFGEAMRAIDMQMLFGPHDFVIEWDHHQEFQSKFKKVLEVLRRFKLSYRLQTFEESEEDLPYMNVALSK